MPVAGKVYTKKILLNAYPKEENAYVTIISNPKGDVWANLGAEDEKSTYVVFERIIKEWNFTDEAGAPLPITAENVEKTLSVFDINQIKTVRNRNDSLK
jgi:hypothetical protein